MQTEGQSQNPPFNPNVNQNVIVQKPQQMTREQLEIQILRMKLAQTQQQVGPQRNNMNQNVVVNNNQKKKVNHLAYCLMTCISGGVCGLCWCGACGGCCPTCE